MIQDRLRQKGARVYLFSAIFFFLFMGGFIYSLYYATMQIDYVWRWYKVPQYFIYQDDIDIKSELKGYVTAVATEGETTVIRIKGAEQTESYSVPTVNILVEEGDMVFDGDILATYTEWKPGLLLQGLWMTLKISFISIVLGILIGLFGGLARISSNPALRWSAIIYIELIRGSPLLVQIFIWYFVLGTLINSLLDQHGFSQIPSLWFGIASLACFAGAYVAEIVRAGIQSIHRGQSEASRSLGMNYVQSMIHVILPQALRRIIPPLAGQFISLIKDSSLLGIIAIRELTKATRELVTTSLQIFELFFVCALLYLILTFTFSMFLQYLERRVLTK